MPESQSLREGKTQIVLSIPTVASKIADTKAARCSTRVERAHSGIARKE